MTSPGTGSASPRDAVISPGVLSALSEMSQPLPSARRLPPPCWSHEETMALIDAYREKWYTLRRSNLKANHWQEVADEVSRRCPAVSPPKTSVQCRHKMEKLRKRYRTELQRARSLPLSRFSSSWVHFKRMDAMERGPLAKPDYEMDTDCEDNDEENDEEDDPRDRYLQNYKNGNRNNNILSSKSMHRFQHNDGLGTSSSMSMNGNCSGYRARLPTQQSPKMFAKADQRYHGNFPMKAKPRPAAPDVESVRHHQSSSDEPAKRGEDDLVEEMVGAIKVLGDGFVRMEQMKMEMAREIEAMRMEMEMKRTEMIVESQQRIVEAFSRALLTQKRSSPSPNSQ